MGDLSKILEGTKQSELQSNLDLLWAVRAPLKKLIKEGGENGIPYAEILHKLDTAIGDKNFKDKIKANVEILEQQLKRISELQALMAQLKKLKKDEL